VSVPVLVLSGPVGVGKTTVAHEMFDQLSGRDVAHAVVDLDALGICWPYAEGDPFNERMALRNLAAVWANYAAAGVDRLIVARVVEAAEDLAGYAEAVPGAELQVCRLTAGNDALRERVKKREVGSSYEALVRRSVELAESLERSGPADFTVATDGRTVSEIADEVLRKAGWVAG
jgi:GTPase SAR1 family protein